MSIITQSKRGNRSAVPVATSFGDDHIAPSLSQDDATDAPMFASGGYYQRMQTRKSNPVPLIAGGVASVAALALIAGTMFMGKPSTDATAAPAQTAAVTQPAPLAPAVTPAAPAQTAQLIPPAPAPTVRRQASIAPRRASPLPAETAADASNNAADVSATVPAVPQPSAATDAAARALAVPAAEAPVVTPPAPATESAPVAQTAPAAPADDGSAVELAPGER